jgi:hypothetical protein
MDRILTARIGPRGVVMLAFIITTIYAIVDVIVGK